MEPPEEFPFPFQAYDIQKSFMKRLYSAIENGKLGIFESPTGTGKSLSLCCGAIQWLKDNEERDRANILQTIEKLKIPPEESNNDDWLYSNYQQIKNNHEIKELEARLANLDLYREKINKLRSQRSLKESQANKSKLWDKKDQKHVKNELEVEDQNNDDKDDFDLLLNDLTDKSDEFDENDGDDNPPETHSTTKIFFCSRTHSQLSQFVNEIKRTSHCSDVSVVSLASRQQYCINPSVQQLKSQHLINEQCLEMQKNKKGKATAKSDGKVTKRSKITTGCSFYNQTNIDNLKDEIIVDIKDVEDLVNAGKQSKACPYYGARASVSDAQIVVVPYQTILHEATRKANGIDIRNNIVIIDEAHNLLETIGHIYSAEIYAGQLQTALDKLKHYRGKFNTRFAAKNLLQLNQFIFIIKKISDVFKSVENNGRIFTLEEFVLKCEIDNYNLRPILDFCVDAKLAQKLHGFCNKYPEEEVVDKKNGLEDFLNQMSKKKVEEVKSDEPADRKYISVGNVIHSAINFLESLTSTYKDGRILTTVRSPSETSSHKFLLLNPSGRFANVIKEARAVIVAGGTMQPLSEFRDQLFISAGAESERIVEFSCGHVIPPENILPICLSEGPTGKRLNFSYEMRKTTDMLNEVGRILLNVCNVISGGIVCFFPSYDYEQVVYNHLKSTGMIDKIQNKKKVFREPKTSTQVDQILGDYSKAVKRKNPGSSLTGALMLSVVGGKLSEGLNFSDDLGRCVIVVGMPYPNIKSPELQEKMKYLNANASPTAGNVHYENLCMKAVNQCIGRAVRHARDYATILLVDERYSKENVRTALPEWIRGSLLTNVKLGTAIGSIGKFFNRHKQSNLLTERKF